MMPQVIGAFCGRYSFKVPDKGRQKVDIYFNFIGCFVPPKPDAYALVREAQRATREAENFLPGWLIWWCYCAILISVQNGKSSFVEVV